MLHNEATISLLLAVNVAHQLPDHKPRSVLGMLPRNLPNLLTSPKNSPGLRDSQTAQQMNHSLIALYKLVAQGSISPRQSAVLGYIGSLVLRSLKSIDYDNDRFPEKHEETSAQTPPAAQPSKDELATKRTTVGPGKEPLPATEQEFAAQALNRKPN